MKCAECNAECKAKFCCIAHKDAYNNRRKKRGAEIYDLFMATRFDRKEASEAGVWAIMCRMASDWKVEDDAASIKSYQPVREVLDRNPQYQGIRGRI